MESATLQSTDKEAPSGASRSRSAPRLRPPVLADGAAVHAIVAACPPLDANSAYCNLLQCAHFASTCVVAESGGRMMGWVSAYRPPEEPDTLFVWQVAVHPQARGQGLALAMLNDLAGRAVCRDITWLKTTITADNRSSWALFNRFASGRGCALNSAVWMQAGLHFPGSQPSEHLVTIGPLGGTGRLS